MNISEYAKSLEFSDSQRSKAKLTVTICGEDILLPDPYNIVNVWFSNPTRLPPTQYKAIYNYLIKTAGPFTGENLEAYKLKLKSLEAVRQYSGEDSSSSVTFVKATVKPGQCVTAEPFKPWLCLDRKEGHLVRSHCTCKARLGEACSQVAALLFGIEAVNNSAINKTVCTSIRCI